MTKKIKKPTKSNPDFNKWGVILAICVFSGTIGLVTIYPLSQRNKLSLENQSQNTAIDPADETIQSYLSNSNDPLMAYANNLTSFANLTTPKHQPTANCPWKSYHLDMILGQVEGEGVGFNTGYTKTELLFYRDTSARLVKPFLDFRGAFFTNGNYDVGAGIGIRYLAENYCRDIGINIYYDYLHLHHANFNQFGVGFDTYGKYWDLRINGYIPFGQKHHLKYISKREYDGGYYSVQHKFINVMSGGDAEIGIPISIHKNFQMYTGFQGYYYKSSENHAGGVAFRVDVLFNKYVSCEFKISHDNYFETRALVGIFFTIPLYSQKSRSNCFSEKCENLELRGWQNVHRSDTIVTDQSSCWFWNW